jgi:hypothetical protein
MNCKHCGKPIRWREGMGWVRGGLDEGPIERCSPDSDTEAAARPEDLW